MTILFVTAEGKKVSKYEAPGPTSYPSGGFDVRIDELNKVEDVLECQITGGYIAKGTVSPPNLVHIVVYQQTSVAGALPEVPAGTDLSAETIKAIVLGY